MKPAYDSASEESEDDAPEAVSLSQSKKTIREQASAFQQAQNAEKEKKRTKNRERDRKLKEQAASKKGKQVAVEEEGDESDDDGDAVMARMRKAMKEAEVESDEDMDDEGSDIDDDDAMLDDDSDDDEEEFHGFDAPQRKTQNPNHLPDHLFTSAFASQSKPALAKGKSKAQQHKEKQKAKKRFRTKPKDIVVGSRVVRTLKDNTTPTGTPAMGPSAKVRKFLDRTLALKPSGNARQRGWERRPASVGSLRTSGPAARFVRS